MRKWLIAIAVMVLSPWAVSLIWMRAAGMEREIKEMPGEWQANAAGTEESQGGEDTESNPAVEAEGQAIKGEEAAKTSAEVTGRGSRESGSSENLIRRKILVERKGIRTYIDLEDYLPGVMVCQMDRDYNLETMKCQAVIARTYIYRLLNGRTEIYEEELDMDYLGEGEGGVMADREKLFNRLEKCREAAEATRGQVMKYEDRYILPLFHAISAGRTRSGDGDFPYLQSVESVADTKREDYMETPKWSRASFAAAINQIPGATPVGAEQVPEQIQTVKKDDAGYVTEMKIGAGIYSGDEIWYALGLSSPCFNIEADGDSIRVRVRGKGHGYGLSQAGADSMAEAGWGYEDILNHYYKNISLIFE
ncbi:MAG: SpoIID/LytB domain-containing protein [Lachnospiraceae bacterium]|jgi:stage II sporulation protein D|nr:SpoIID/LytB domain-containing protein [Lachnospiraceae bacterium]